MSKTEDKQLLIDDFGVLPDFAALEEKVADFWDDNQIFAKSMSQTDEENQVKKPWIFYDGPPFATGLPHYGHLLASTTKDVLPRFKTMQGFFVSRRWGWDCHGLPIENIIEKELGLKDRPSILSYGVDKFCDSCRDKVLIYADEWKKIIRRLGRFVDMENDYKTMDSEFMESEWWVFKTLWDKGLIYKDYKPMHLCPRCSTPLSNFEVTQGYKDVTDLTAFVKFKLDEPETLNLRSDTYLIAWTTTPWTLPGNFLLAVDNELEYSVIELAETPGEYLIIATSRLGEVVPAEQKYTIISAIFGRDLVGKTYEPIFPYFIEEKSKSNAFRIVDADFISSDEGTGIVHIAPAFGEDDFNLGKREKMPIIHHVDENGRFTKSVTDFAGRLVKDKDEPMATDIEIIKYLATHRALFRKQKVKHSYPHCWRCDTPLLNYATSSYFVSVSQIKDKLLATNDKINWQPTHMKYGRFGKWLEGARDWAISRNRFWGTPLPLWVSEKGDDFICVGSKEELEKLSGQWLDDLHKPTVDKIVIEKNGQKYHRISEVLDCWFESGSMPYASCHYPFNNRDTFDNFFPADFISEGQDQTRGWFYTLHVLATALTGEVGEDKKPAIKVAEGNTGAYKNVLVSGIVLAEDGKKMSKKLQNYPDPLAIINKYGADTLRFYLMSSPAMRAENLNFSEKDVADLRRRLLVILWNVVAFYKGVVTDEDLNLSESQSKPGVIYNIHIHVLDEWLFSRNQQYLISLTKSLEKFDLPSACQEVLAFVDDLSTWYLRLSRDRLRDDAHARAALACVLRDLIVSLAPLLPFTSEILYHNLPLVQGCKYPKKSSVHLEEWVGMKTSRRPYYHSSLDDYAKTKLANMEKLRTIVENARAKRAELGLKLRQPLAKLNISSDFDALIHNEEVGELLKQELNVKEIVWQKNNANTLELDFDTNLTPELIAEGEARELMRQIKDARKKAGLKESDNFEFHVANIPDGWQEKIETATNTKLLTN